MPFSVSGGRLLKDGQPVRFRASPNVGGPCQPRFLVMHFTSGGFDGAVEWLCNGNRPNRSSAHLVISEAGEVVQLVPFDRAAWHAGPSAWRDVTGTLNPVAIGIELANYGELDGAPGRYSFAGRPVPDARVLVARHKNGGQMQPWHTYPSAQIATAIEVARALDAAYRFEEIVGHDDIAPLRKTDPGPAFDMAGFRTAVGTSAPPSPKAAPPASTTPAAKPAKPAPAPIEIGSAEDLQRALNELGYGPIAVDGDIGAETRAATKLFQAARGLTVDGVAGPKTWAELRAALAA